MSLSSHVTRLLKWTFGLTISQYLFRRSLAFLCHFQASWKMFSILKWPNKRRWCSVEAGKHNMAKNSYFKVKGSWHQCTVKTRRWYSGEHSCLPSSWPGFDSRPTHLGDFPFLLESVTSSPSVTCLPHGSKSFAVVQTHAEENTLSLLLFDNPFAKILRKRTESVT